MKVIYSIKNVQFSKITSTTTTGVPTYAAPIPVAGTVSLEMSSESTLEPFYADGIAYYTPAGSTSYSGTLVNALFNDTVLKEIFNYIEDTNGNIVETDAGSNEFGMQFACESDEGDVYFTYYRVSATKPAINVTTKEASATINTQSISITASPITLSTGQSIVHSHATKEATNYANYFTAITIPTVQQ